MTTRVKLSRTCFDSLVKHLVDIEEKKNSIIDEYFPEPSKKRDELKKLFDTYIKQLEQLINSANRSEEAGKNNYLPFVTIGSEVEVQNLDNQEIYKYRLVSPFNNDTENDDAVSYLSPVGRALLLKKVNDVVAVKAPAGVFNYKIKSVRLCCL
ncbi:MAG: GreA/GreB family elongation factor [Firmicutes bacterium]|nr:GreA/GreB family elongation factor [Bacillota bacterium]